MCFTNPLLLDDMFLDKIEFRSERIDCGSIDTVTLEPHWSWTSNVKPFLSKKSKNCTLQHNLKILSGVLAIKYEHKQRVIFYTSDDPPFEINYPHIAWVYGNESCSFVHFEEIVL